MAVMMICGVDDYRVQLDVYNGPLDLLLYLIRREEIAIYDIPIARLTEQYLAYVELLHRLDPDSAADFLVMAAMLMEIKSRALLPRLPAMEDGEAEEFVDPRLELVRQLLEYKRVKDAARSLELAAQIQALRHARKPVLPEAPPEGVDLDDVQLWDLFEAFQQLLEETGQRDPVHQVERDDTPITLYADDIIDSLERHGGVQPFEEVFAGRTKAEMIGLFLALLELIRERRVQARQEELFGRIDLYLLDATPIYGAVAEPNTRMADEATMLWGNGIPEEVDKGADDDASEGDELSDDPFEWPDEKVRFTQDRSGSGPPPEEVALLGEAEAGRLVMPLGSDDPPALRVHPACPEDDSPEDRGAISSDARESEARSDP